jgi:hypothetical protein
VQDLVEPVWCCALIGGALSLVVAAALSRPTRRAASSILPRLLLVGVPVYLGVNYLLYQDAALIAGAVASFAFGLYWLRGWWLPGSNAVLRSRIYGAGAFFFPRRRRATRASAVLRYRVHGVVRGDRRLVKAG